MYWCSCTAELVESTFQVSTTSLVSSIHQILITCITLQGYHTIPFIFHCPQPSSLHFASMNPPKTHFSSTSSKLQINRSAATMNGYKSVPGSISRTCSSLIRRKHMESRPDVLFPEASSAWYSTRPLWSRRNIADGYRIPNSFEYSGACTTTR